MRVQPRMKYCTCMKYNHFITFFFFYRRLAKLGTWWRCLGRTCPMVSEMPVPITKPWSRVCNARAKFRFRRSWRHPAPCNETERRITTEWWRWASSGCTTSFWNGLCMEFYTKSVRETEENKNRYKRDHYQPRSCTLSFNVIWSLETIIARKK